MKIVLLIFWATMGGNSIDQIEFDSMEACVVGIINIKTHWSPVYRPTFGRQPLVYTVPPRMMCVEK